MRLGVVGMLPNTLAEIAPHHLQAIRDLRLTGAGLSLPGAAMAEVDARLCDQVQAHFVAAEIDLVQLVIGFGGCLFDPDAAVRRALVDQIGRGLEVSHAMGAHVSLIRTGSLSPNGSYSPSRANHAPVCRPRLLDSLQQVAEKAEAIGQRVVIETHVLTIMNSPEINVEIIEAVGSDHLGVVMDYVNHFQALHQVYNSTARINHIFNIMGPISFIGHCKDIRVRDGFVVHFDEEVPGEGELDLATALRRWHGLHPDGYMMLEHLPVAQYPLAAQNVHRILAQAQVPVY